MEYALPGLVDFHGRTGLPILLLPLLIEVLQSSHLAIPPESEVMSSVHAFSRAALSSILMTASACGAGMSIFAFPFIASQEFQKVLPILNTRAAPPETVNAFQSAILSPTPAASCGAIT